MKLSKSALWNPYLYTFILQAFSIELFLIQLKEKVNVKLRKFLTFLLNSTVNTQGSTAIFWKFSDKTCYSNFNQG